MWRRNTGFNLLRTSLAVLGSAQQDIHILNNRCFHNFDLKLVSPLVYAPLKEPTQNKTLDELPKLLENMLDMSLNFMLSLIIIVIFKLTYS